MSFGLIFSPIWYPIYLIIRKQKHLLYLELLSLIISRDVDVFGVTQHDVQMKKIKSASTDAFTFDYDMLLMDQLNELIEEKESWLVARIDWKATDEVEPQLNALLTTHNIKGHFRATTLSESVDSIPFALCEFDYWLVNKQYRFILWDQGSDEYTGFICETSSCERLLELAKKLTLTFKVDMANEFNICVDKATVIEHLTFLIASSKARNIKQDIDTFSFFVDGLNDPECSDINALYESLYSQTCGMMRYADYTDEEYEKVMSLIHILQLYEVKMKAGLSDF
ncbi:DUF6630 family protein [Psychromonas algicola]|uniref:DUF6630 family protein n=1 Tax=Psychromonas algicola TaxID=2555642 RepID=UPI001067CFCD|nr:hypothetical protein [Psychromonas sp. RZ5]TEW43040.1 hypothetical protein E2R67_16175 [Psychromonas sp. RZ5]